MNRTLDYIFFSYDEVWILVYLVLHTCTFYCLTGLVISYEFLSFIQLAYRWLITYCALVLLILSRMMHQVPYDTLVLICDWWLGTFNYLEKNPPIWSLPCLVHTIEMIWCQMRQKKIYLDALKKCHMWKTFVQSSVANSNDLKLSLNLLAIT